MLEALDPDAVCYVQRYVPRCGPRPIWASIEHDVRDFVLRSVTTLESAKTACSHAAAYACWVSGEGLSTSAADLADAETIERYIQVGMAGRGDRSRATRRAVLRRLASRVAPPTIPPPEAIRYRFIRPPYDADTVARYLTLASNQPTQGRRVRVLAILGLGLGAGLDGRDLPWITACSVSSTRDGLAVEVAGGPRPRTVIALERYAELIRTCARACPDGPLVGGERSGQRNLTSQALAKVISDGSLPPLVTSRLRSTWLTTHLELGTPLTVLLPAAGLTTARPLEDLLPHVRAVDASRASALLRGSTFGESVA